MIARGGAQIGAPQTVPTVLVSAGIFTVQLDFGAGAFPGASRFLEIGARLSGGGAFTILSPRQQITSTPYAIRSLNASTADSVIVNGVPGGSGNYIQNTTAQQAASNFNISGTGTAGGTLSGNVVNAATQYNLGGTRILSNAGQRNLFAGEGAGQANSGLGSNAFFGYHAGFNNTTGVRNNFFGSVAGENNTQGSDNNFFGDSAGRFNTGDGNSFFGSNAGRNNAGIYNAFFGFSAGQSNTTGGANSFFGRDAGFFNTTGASNSFFGFSAGQSNTTGVDNSFFGRDAGQSNTTGVDNSFFGVLAGQNNSGGDVNSFFGSSAGQSNREGVANSFFGSNAGLSNTTGHFNSFFGRFAGFSNTIGSNNTIIGDLADVGSGNLTFATAIGSGAEVSRSNAIVLGRPAIGGIDFVGVGISDPQRLLDVNGRARVRVIPFEASAAAVCFNAVGDLLQCGASSLRLKTNVQPFAGGLDIVRRLRPITYNWKESGLADLGLGAEDVAQVAPSFVFTNDKGEAEGVKYERLNILLINAVKEQQEQIEALRAQNSRLTARLRSVENVLRKRVGSSQRRR